MSSLLLTDETLPFERFVTLNPRYGTDTRESLSRAAYAGRKPGVDVGIWADADNPSDGNAAMEWGRGLWKQIRGESHAGYPSLLDTEGNAKAAIDLWR